MLPRWVGPVGSPAESFAFHEPSRDDGHSCKDLGHPRIPILRRSLYPMCSKVLSVDYELRTALGAVRGLQQQQRQLLRQVLAVPLTWPIFRDRGLSPYSPFSLLW